MFETILLAYYLHHFALPQGPAGSLAGADLTVELSQPAVVSVPPGTQRVPMLTLQLSASCAGDVTVESLRVRRRGLGASADILTVYGMSDGRRMSSGNQLSRSGEADLHFRELRVPACGKRSLDILADFAPVAAVAGEHWLTVEHAGGVEAGGATVRLLREAAEPVRKRTSGGPARGVIQVEYLSLLTTVRYGDNRTVARLRLRADGRERHRIFAITLTNEGSARGNDLENLSFHAGRGGPLGPAAPEMDGDRVRAVFDPPLVLERNQERVLELHADVRVGSSKTLRFVLEEPGDLEAEPFSGR